MNLTCGTLTAILFTAVLLEENALIQGQMECAQNKGLFSVIYYKSNINLIVDYLEGVIVKFVCYDNVVRWSARKV